jgi:uncharacterized protein YndB with AHSA1/START domain
MPAYEPSVAVAASREAVWRVLSDVAGWPEWLPTVPKVEPLDETPLSVGSRFVVHQPKVRPATWVVSEIDPPRRFVWVARSPGIETVADHTVTEDSPGTASVVLRLSFSGFLGSFVGNLFGTLTRTYLAQEAASLKQRVEASR